MRLITHLLCGTFALLLCSCASMDMIDKAQGLPGPLDPPNQAVTKPNPAYYLLVPVVFPFDAVAWPFQYAYLNNRHQQGNGSYQNAPPPPPPGPGYAPPGQ